VLSSLQHDEAVPLSQLRSAVRGDVIVAADPRYDAARAVYFSGFDSRPAAIIRPHDASDVARVVMLAHDHGFDLAVRSGGHSLAGHGTCSGVVLDLSSMRSIEIDAAARTAWAETGLTAGDYTHATGAYGLATGFGDAPSVGIGGITLAGGVGFLHRVHGLTIDNVLAADVVTADSRIVRASAESEPDLFWAIRGGGGNFGVVTRIQYRLAPVSDVVGGMMMAQATPDVVTRFIAAAQAAPDALSGMINIMPAPPMPGLPPELHGSIMLMAALVYDGPAAEGEKVFAPLRAIAAPFMDMIQPLPYPRMFDAHAEAPHFAGMAIRNMFRDDIDMHAAETIVDGLTRSTAPMSVVQVRVLGGAVARVAPSATAFPHRTRGMMLNVAAAFQDLEQRSQHDAWATGLAGALRQGEPGAYVAFIGNEGAERPREAYGSSWDRLCAVKRTYDPDNVFRLNQNIPPR
jgi:FAD/FMN-containing dehydrogenase